MKNVIWLIIAILLTGCMQLQKENGSNDVVWDLSEKRNLDYSYSSVTDIEKKQYINTLIKNQIIQSQLRYLQVVIMGV